MALYIQVCPDPWPLTLWTESKRNLSLTSTATVDIKPDNILVNHGINGSRFSKVQLADCGDSIRAKDVGDFTKHIIGADFFRSPESLLRQPWDTPTDIWSFGATVSDGYLSSWASVAC